jgi:hypothetical protein
MPDMLSSTVLFPTFIVAIRPVEALDVIQAKPDAYGGKLFT